MSDTNDSQTWFVYMIKSNLDSLYTGITTSLEKRFLAHQSKKRGAKFFHFCEARKIVFWEKHPSRSLATKREIEIKKMTRNQKLILIEAFNKNHELGKTSTS